MHATNISSNNLEYFEPENDVDFDFDVDSSYASLKDLDERADFYNDLLKRFRTKRPMLINHNDNTKKMIQKQK